MLYLPFWRCAERIIQLGVHYNALDLVRLPDPLPGSFEDVGNYQAVHALVLAIVNLYVTHLTIHAARAAGIQKHPFALNMIGVTR